MKITIIRHGKPDLTSTNWITSAQMGAWISTYNIRPLAESSVPSAELIKIIEKECNGIVCSTLRRSVESAELLSKNKIVLQSNNFIEAELPYANNNFFKLPPGAWAVLFRLSWVCGYHNNSESRSQAQARAKVATEKLIQLAQTHGHIAVVGHGIFNRLVARELRKNGWQANALPSRAHWGYTVHKAINQAL